MAKRLRVWPRRRALGLLALPLLLATEAAAQPAHRTQPVAVDLALVLAVDVSGSIDEQEATLQRHGYVEAFRHPDVIAAILSGPLGRIAVSYIEWAGEGWQVPVLDWTVIGSAAEARAFANRLEAAPVGAGPWTSISSAIDFASMLFGDKEVAGARQAIDISGDGANNTGRPVTAARDEAVAHGIAINGLPIVNNHLNFGRRQIPNLDLYYRHCVIGGPGAFIVVAHSFDDFAEAIRRKLVLEISGRSTSPPATAGRITRLAPGLAQATAPAGAVRGGAAARWVPPCDIGERRLRGFTEP